MKLHPRLLAVVCSAGLLAACGPTPPAESVELHFAALAGSQPVKCGSTVTGLGTSQTTFELEDLRFYVHDFRGVDAAGAEVPLDLIADDLWQSEEVALIDFEDKTGGCSNGTAETRDRVVVRAADTELHGLRFRLGVPESLNHGDASVAKSPLNLSTMFWGWKAGYKHLRLEGRTTGLSSGYDLHLGSNGCDGDPVVCAQPGQVDVTLDEFHPSTDVIALDLAELFATSNLDANADTTPPGCMSSPASDPDCAPIFERLGLTGAAGQKAFRRETAK